MNDHKIIGNLKEDEEVSLRVRHNKWRDGVFLEIIENEGVEYPRCIADVELRPSEVHALIRALRLQLKENRQK